MFYRVLLITAFVISLTVEIQSQQEITKLEVGNVIVRELNSGQEQNYRITLSQKQYACIIVEQRGIDVVIQLLGTDGNVILTTDDEYRTNGQEKIEIVAETDQSYQLRIKSSSNNAPSEQYEIRIAEIRAATENDRLLFEVHKLDENFNQASQDGKYKDAQQSIERALAISESVLGPEHPYVATQLFQLGNYYEDKQDNPKSIMLYERALAISERTLGSENALTINIMRSLAGVYIEVNEIAKAEQLADRAVETSQKMLGPEHPVVIKCLSTLAYVTGDSKKEEQLLQRALLGAEKTMGAENQFVSVVLNQFGNFYMGQGDYQKAELLLLRSQAIKEKTLGPDNISNAVTLVNLGMIIRQKKDYKKAEEIYKRAIEIVENAFGSENPRLAMILNNIANIYRATGDYTRALETHLRVLRISETTRGPYHFLTMLSLGNIAKTYAAQGDVWNAIQFQSRVDEVIEHNIELNMAIGPERQKLSYLNLMSERTDRTIYLNVDIAPNLPAASALAALVVLQRKGRAQDAMSDSFASLRLPSTTEEEAPLKQYNDTTAELAALVLNGPQTITFEEHQEKINKLEKEKEQLEAEISRRSAEFRAHSQPVTIASIQAAIPTNAALIEFAIYRPFDPKAENNSEAYKQPRYIAYVLRHEGEVLWQDLGDEKGIDDAIESFREALRDSQRSDLKRLARVVDEKIMQPIRPLLGDASQLLISPDGSLNLIPFEALIDEQNRYLVQNFSCTYLSSGRDLLRLKVARESKTGPMVLANPLFGEPMQYGSIGKKQLSVKQQNITTAADISDIYFAPLAGTVRESLAIKSLFQEATVLSGSQATEDSLKRVAAPSILHIATHGFFLTDTPESTNSSGDTRSISANAKIGNPLLRSGLALAGANLHHKTGEDGILTALEASGLNLWGTKLVTLSACDTGLGEIKNGEGVYGLRRAFVLAGTETLLMSLWAVSDSVTHEIMTSYYKNLKQGLGRGEALRQVQLNMLKDKRRQHPYYWASFIQSGEWANLEGNR
ncbi:CHAT domain-containing protein [bacterium]|nr:CHAT domain-containing protein [bacterium]